MQRDWGWRIRLNKKKEREKVGQLTEKWWGR